MLPLRFGQGSDAGSGEPVSHIRGDRPLFVYELAYGPARHSQYAGQLRLCYRRRGENVFSQKCAWVRRPSLPVMQHGLSPYVGPLQIIFQMPYETGLAAASVVVVSNNTASSAAPVTVQQAAPFLLTYGSNRAVAVNQDGSVNASGNGAKPGSVLVAYLIGSGPLGNAIATGADAPPSPLSREKLLTSVSVGGSAATVQFAGMTPGFAGLVQVNFVMPNLAPGDYPVQVTIGGAASNQPLLTVSR